jgi:hypothetical protein
MPDNSSIETALSLIRDDPSKILGLNFGPQNVQPGDKIPRAGKI